MDFLRAYVYPNEAFRNSRNVFSDCRLPFTYFWRALHQSDVDEREVFFATSTFAAMAPFIRKEQRQRIINYSFYDIIDYFAEIPMFGKKESFNVSVAAGIALYALKTIAP